MGSSTARLRKFLFWLLQYSQSSRKKTSSTENVEEGGIGSLRKQKVWQSFRRRGSWMDLQCSLSPCPAAPRVPRSRLSRRARAVLEAQGGQQTREGQLWSPPAAFPCTARGAGRTERWKEPALCPYIPSTVKWEVMVWSLQRLTVEFQLRRVKWSRSQRPVGGGE